MDQEDVYTNLKARFVRSFMDFVVLHMLNRESLWGYKIMLMLRETYGIKVGPSVIYPLLESMLNDELLETDEVWVGKRSRKMFRLTEKGLKKLMDLKIVIKEFVS